MKISLEDISNTYIQHRIFFDDLDVNVRGERVNFKELSASQQLDIVQEAMDHPKGVRAYLAEEGESCPHDEVAQNLSHEYHSH